MLTLPSVPGNALPGEGWDVLGKWEVKSSDRLRAGVSHSCEEQSCVLGYVSEQFLSPLQFVVAGLFGLRALAWLSSSTPAVIC